MSRFSLNTVHELTIMLRKSSGIMWPIYGCPPAGVAMVFSLTWLRKNKFRRSNHSDVAMLFSVFLLLTYVTFLYNLYDKVVGMMFFAAFVMAGYLIYCYNAWIKHDYRLPKQVRTSLRVVVVVSPRTPSS